MYVIARAHDPLAPLRWLGNDMPPPDGYVAPGAVWGEMVTDPVALNFFGSAKNPK